MAGLSHGRRRLLLRGRIVLPGKGVRSAAGPVAWRSSSGTGLPHVSPDSCLRIFARIFALSLLLSLSLPPARAFARQAAVSEAPIVSEVRFAGHPFFSDETLRLHIRTRANRRFLGIPGANWWLWLYRFGDTLGGGIGRALKATGEPPAFLDSTVVAADVERLRLFYAREGFQKASVEARIEPAGADDRVRVVFVIEAGEPTFVREVRYDGVESLEDEQKLRLTRGTLLRHEHIDEDDPLRFRARDQRYSAPTLLEEGRRLLTFLHREGYAAATRDSIHAIVVPVRADSFDVIFRLRPGPRYRFGDVHFAVTGPQPEAPPRHDTLATPPPEEGVAGGRITIDIEGEPHLDDDLLLRALRFTPGMWYNQDELLATKRRLDATGVFAFTDILSQPEDTVRVPPDNAPRLPHRIEARTRQRHQIRLETFMIQRSGALADTDNELGAGIGVTYENLNLFGGGESFRFRMTGSLAADLDAKLGVTSSQWEVATALTYPYLIAPFHGLDDLFDLFETRTQLSLSLLAARREALRLVLRGRGTARFRLEMWHTPTVVSFIDLLDLSLNNPDTLRGFKEAFLDDVLRSIPDTVQQARIIEDYTQPQINNALRYTLRSARLNPLTRDAGYSYEASFEIGGNLPYLLDRFVFSPDSLEGAVPGLPFFGGGSSGNRLIYRQYLRFVGDVRQYRPVRRHSVLAWKFIVGVAHPTGRADIIPFDRRFYSGGAASVRGWRLRELGPGTVTFTGQGSPNDGAPNILGGDIKLETSIEWRNTFLSNVLKANWIAAFFTDAGNVWFGPRNPGTREGRFRFDSFYRELGVGSGVGLRIAWEYLILRLDLAVKVHDPVRQGELLPDGLRNPLLHFGIGHAF
ncbi:BamA/TamA family outer membrane protein [Rhodocaloribacter sp.]